MKGGVYRMLTFYLFIFLFFLFPVKPDNVCRIQFLFRKRSQYAMCHKPGLFPTTAEKDRFILVPLPGDLTELFGGQL